jgi:hypothetical protein
MERYYYTVDINRVDFNIVVIQLYLNGLYAYLIILRIISRIFNYLILLRLELYKQPVHRFKRLLDRAVAALLIYFIYLVL